MRAIIPTEYQPPLIIDSNTVKASKVTAQSFEPICRWRTQIVQTMRAVQAHCERGNGKASEKINREVTVTLSH